MATSAGNFDLGFDLDDCVFEEVKTEEKDEFLLPSTSKKRRFAEVSSEDINELLKEAENKNTKKKTESDLRLIRVFISETCPDLKETELEYIEDATLSDILCKFFTVAKKQDGGEYEPATIRGIMASVERHILAKTGKKISCNQQFAKVQDVMKSKMKMLKRSGKGNLPNRASPLTDEDIEKLWRSGQLGMENPRSITNTLWWFNTLHFGMRTVTPHHQMRWGDVQLKTDSDGQRFLAFNERSTKTRTGVNVKKDAHESAIAYENTDDPNRCPVELYIKYESLRPDTARSPDSPFYLAYNTRRGIPKQGEMWFKNQPIGINTIGSLMKNMAAAANVSGDDKKISNHTARKTLVQKLCDHDIEPNKIVQVSGHRNLQSINSYATLSQKQHQNISQILNSTVMQAATEFREARASREPRQESTRPTQQRQQPAVHFQGAVYGGVFNFNFN